MLCYVGGDVRKYYKWEDNVWSEFSSGSGGGDNSSIFRVDTIEDRDNIITTNLEYGSLCHVLNDENFRYMYYYGKDGWESISHEYKVWIGDEPPEDKKALWIDTSIINMDTENESSIPSSIKSLLNTIRSQNDTIINLNSRINVLENELETIKKQIESGGIIDNNMYLATEDGDIFITEDGIPMISEEGVSSGGEEVVQNALLTENGDYLLTEDGKNIIQE